jgi:hypothetical protein
MIQPVPKSNKEEKSITRQVNLAISTPPATTEYLHWSEQPIEFSRDDHPIIVPLLGNASLVLKAQIGMYDVDGIFMDAGSGIILIYAKTLRAMHISLEFCYSVMAPGNMLWRIMIVGADVLVRGE